MSSDEWLDAEFDRFHPHKHLRAAAAGRLKPLLVYAEYLVLAIVGVALAANISTLFFVTTLVFLVSGIVYNVNPIRTKDRAYFDVISESFNNPIRIMLGWSMVSETTVPPTSLIFIFWFGGAFLMAIKRYGEYRLIKASPDSNKSLASYRKSFGSYSETSLLVSSFSYAMLCAFALGVFLIKYRTEYVLAFPFFTALFSYYLYLGIKDSPSVQAPEKLYKEGGLLLVLSLLIAAVILLTVIDLPFLSTLIQSSFTLIKIS